MDKISSTILRNVSCGMPNFRNIIYAIYLILGKYDYLEEQSFQMHEDSGKQRRRIVSIDWTVSSQNYLNNF